MTLLESLVFAHYGHHQRCFVCSGYTNAIHTTPTKGDYWIHPVCLTRALNSPARYVAHVDNSRSYRRKVQTMPGFEKGLTSEDFKRAAPTSQQDLTPYYAIIDRVTAEGLAGAQLSLAEGESERTEKRRLSTAAKARNLVLTWRKAPTGKMRFVLAKEGETAVGSRTRTPKSGLTVAEAEAIAAKLPVNQPANDNKRQPVAVS